MQVAVIFGALAALLAFRYWWHRRNAVYLLDLACFKPPDRLKVSVERFLTGSRASGVRHPSKANGALTIASVNPHCTCSNANHKVLT